MPSPLDRLLDAVEMKCTKCGKTGRPLPSCDCWERCSCGHYTEPGKGCLNPITTRCTTKLKYPGTWAVRATLCVDRQPVFILRSTDKCYYISETRDGKAARVPKHAVMIP